MIHDEGARLDALYRLNLLDSAPSESFDRITRMAGQIFGLPIAAVSLTDRDRQWFKSRIGVDHQSLPRDKAPCSEVAETSRTLLIPDLLDHPYYGTSLLAEQGVRFYAGAALTTREGHSLGALCVLGTEPREASAEELNALADLAQMVMAQIELQHAFGRIDPVSGLPNRTQFIEDLADLGRDRPGQRRLAVLVDLARSEELSNGVRVLGAAYLDESVRAAARSISRALLPSRTAYQVAATQFAFLAPEGVDEAAYIEQLADQLEGFRAEAKNRFVLSTALGVAPFVAGETDPAAVIRLAHGAALDARASETMVGIYSAEVDVAHQRRFRLLNDFAEALDRECELSLLFQPRVELATGRCVGAEALLRWQHPELGWISPAEFIPIVEQTSLAAPLTAWVLDKGLAQLARWQSGGRSLQLSINVSAANLQQNDFAGEVRLSLAKHGLGSGTLELEVTESAMMTHFGQAQLQLTELAEAGVRIAIDDFGTGYSSLAYLQRLPASILKIDQSFVREVPSGDRARTLVKSIVSLAQDLDYRVVAEGVETSEVAEILVRMGCEEAQGYFFARPMAADAFNSWYDGLAPVAAPNVVTA